MTRTFINISSYINRLTLQIIGCLSVLISCCPTMLAQHKTSPLDYVNTLVGTMSSYELSNGNTYPVISTPWGMNSWTPQTGKMGNGWQYTYTANKIVGFKQTHQPSPWINDYGQFSVMPTVGNIVFDEDKRASWFSHKAEKATPYYYSVYLADYDIKTEITPTERAAIIRLTYPNTAEARLVIDAFDKGSYIRVDKQRNMIYGYSTKNSGGVHQNFRNYFVMSFNKPFSSFVVVDDGEIRQDRETTECNHAGAVVTFNTNHNESVIVKVASSFISEEQALLNLREVADKSFEDVLDYTKQQWNEQLGRIEIEDADIDNLRTFYSCLYRSLLFPRMFYEYDKNNKPIHYSPHNGKTEKGYFFTDTGFWDTFRSLFPLLNLIYPEINRKIQSGLANHYKESGFIPEWASPGHRDCMVGNNSASVVADAIVKNITDKDDINTLWHAVTRCANSVHPTISSTGRLGYDYYNKLGYIPYDVGINESVARSLEYAYADWCIYIMGKHLNKKRSEIEPYLLHANNYKRVFNKTDCLMRPKLQNGSWAEPFNPLKWGDAFTEGNSWHYTWSVFHDVEGLSKLMGGHEKMTEMLDSVFNLPPLFDESYYGQVIHEIREMQIADMGNYAHGNQPIQHVIYLYNYTGQPWKTQYWAKEIMNKLYRATPDGYPGDEDNGQTSAWYVFSALGFYPVCPVSNQYVIGSPLFQKVKIHLDNDRKISIEADKPKLRYINSIEKDGKEYLYNYFDHFDLIKGTSIKFNMSEKANKQRGTQKEAFPYSLTKQ